MWRGWCAARLLYQAVCIAMPAVINRTALSVIRFLIKHATASSLRPSIVYCAPPVGGIRQCCDLSVGLSVCRPTTCTGWAKKRGHRHMTIILSILKTDLRFFFTGRFLFKFAVKRISKIPPHLAYVATLAGETLMSAK